MTKRDCNAIPFFINLLDYIVKFYKFAGVINNKAIE